MALKLLITDFDGTLVDTFEANFRAYAIAFKNNGLSLDRQFYKKCFGLRFDDFMIQAGIYNRDLYDSIKIVKSEFYPSFFKYLKVNRPLLEVLRQFRHNGGKTALASTARRKNLINALRFIGADNDFDLILSGENVKQGKPNPEIYLKVLEQMSVTPNEALVFEDSKVGFEAASASGINYLPINQYFFNYGD